MFSPADTIVAIATPPGRGGIGVVRISGPCARDVARVMVVGPSTLAPRHATLARFRDRDGRVLDEVLVTLFPAPHSYTAEDVVEVSSHGSPSLLREVLRAAVAGGARLAEPGEFTFRAFLNGRLDLVQAEAVADLVDAVTPLQARVAFDQLEGTLTRAIGDVDRRLFDLAARLEASLDFPDEGFHFVERGEAAATLSSVCARIDTLLEAAAMGRLIREGQQIAILGKPNVGKSSLFNWLVGSDRAIVADLPGTTRDLVTETIDFEGIRLGLVDTAGIRSGQDEVEREGVGRARRSARVADFVLVVCDVSRPAAAEDHDVLAETASARRVVVLNKADLGSHRDWEQTAGVWAGTTGDPADAVDQPAGGGDVMPGGASGSSWRPASAGRVRPARPPGDVACVVSLKTGEGLGDLRRAIRRVLSVDSGDALRDGPMVSNVRHENLLREAREALARARAGIDARGDASEELVLADIAEARRAFEDLTGRRTTDDLLRHIFERFCVGK